MITLFTTDAQSRFDPNGMIRPAKDLRNSFEELAKKIADHSDRVSQPTAELIPHSACEATLEASSARPSGHHILFVGQTGNEVSPKSVPVGIQNPVVVRLFRPHSVPTDNSWVRAFVTTDKICRAVDTFVQNDRWPKHLVFIDDADFYFYPGQELGTFTQTLDNDKDMIEFVDTIGGTLAAFEGHLFLAAAFLQDPQRLLDFLRKYGWSWVWHHGGRFEIMFGDVPRVLEDCIAVPHEAMPETKLEQLRQPPLVVEAAPVEDDRYIFRREDTVWHIRFETEEAQHSSFREPRSLCQVNSQSWPGDGRTRPSSCGRRYRPGESINKKDRIGHRRI